MIVRRSCGSRRSTDARVRRRRAWRLADDDPGPPPHMAPGLGGAREASAVIARRRPAHRSAAASASSTTRTTATGSSATAPPGGRRLDAHAGLYDLVFGSPTRDPDRAGVRRRARRVPLGQDVLRLQGLDLLEDAGRMGDVVFAPLYQALRAARRRVRVLPPGRRAAPRPDRRTIDAVDARAAGRLLAPGVARYDPLVPVKDLPCFPLGSARRPARRRPAPTVESRSERSARGSGLRLRLVLRDPRRDGPHVCAELIADRPEWRRDGRPHRAPSRPRRSSSGSARTSRARLGARRRR